MNTAVATLATLSAASTLSTILAVDSSPLVPHTAMSPAPIITAAPANASSVGAAPEGARVRLTSGEQESSRPVSATADTSVAAPRTNRLLALITRSCCALVSASSGQNANPTLVFIRLWRLLVYSTFRLVPGLR